MREIEFRGKSDEDWIYGMLLKTEEDDFGEHGDKRYDYLIQTQEDKEVERKKYYITNNKSIGQYTGLKDKNGKKIFEGDIVTDGNEIGKVFFSQYYCGYFIKYEEEHPLYDGITEVIGNITDNPELLK